MKILTVEPGYAPYEEEIDGSLKSMQEIVSGSIEAHFPYRDPVALVCNEEGKFGGFAMNRKVNELNDIIYGRFFLCAIKGEDFVSLSPDLLKKYREKFLRPERFLWSEGRIQVNQADPPAYAIYQLKDIEGTRKLQFQNFQKLAAEGKKPELRNYDCVYQGTLRSLYSLDGLFWKFNENRPADFTGHSLSVSDVIEIRMDGKRTAYYVDSFGFQNLKDFFPRQEKETSLSHKITQAEKEAEKQNADRHRPEHGLQQER